jgi:hypothetical protein
MVSISVLTAETSIENLKFTSISKSLEGMSEVNSLK